MFRFTLRDVLWFMAVVALGVAFYLERDRHVDPREAIVGTWEVVEATTEGKLQKGQTPPEWIKIDKHQIAFGKQNRDFDVTYPCTLTNREIDIDVSSPRMQDAAVFKGIYELKWGELRIIFTSNPNAERPHEFDALKNKQLSRYVLKKIAE